MPNNTNFYPGQQPGINNGNPNPNFAANNQSNINFPPMNSDNMNDNQK